MSVISYKKDFLFIHNPKAAGRSVIKALKPYSENPQQYFYNRLLGHLGIHVNHFGPYRGKWFRQHTTAEVIRSNLPTEVYDSLFKFAFVRNPWDSLVSQYHFIQLCFKDDKKHYNRVKNKTFEEFVYWWLNKPKKSRQKIFVTDNQGNCIVDYVGRFESLAEDHHKILSILGIPGKLDHIGASKHRDYRTYYDDKLAEYVGNILAADADYFGYNFDGVIHTPSFMQCA